MPHRKSSGSRSVRAVPGKSMGSYGKAKIAAKVPVTATPPKPQETVATSAVEPDAEMIACDLFPEGPVEKEIAYYRRSKCPKKGCDCCLPSGVTL